MKHYRKIRKCLHFCLLVFLLVSAGQARADVRLFSIGSGDLSGGYFATAKAICRAFNAADTTQRRCSPEPTAGSIYNLTMLRAGELDFALVQSDWQRAAYEGNGPFANTGPMADLRSVIALYPETITILAAPDSGITKTADLAEKIVDIGRPSSGRNATVRTMLTQMGLDVSFFGDIQEYETGQSIDELCAGRIDAAIFVVGHPSSIVAEAMENCGVSIIAAAGPNVDRIVDDRNDYRKVKIDLGQYGIEGEEVDSFAVVATLVTRASMEPSLVADLVQAIEANAEDLSTSVPLLRFIKLYMAAQPGKTAPEHAGVSQSSKNETVQ